MSKTVISKVDGFTPCFDNVTKDLGIVTSSVFGAIWRFCQMEDGYCRASQETIGERVGLTRQAVNENVKKLIQGGYLESNGIDTSGTIRLFDTGKAGMSISITGVVVETDRGCQPTLQEGVNQPDTKKELKKELKKVSSSVQEPTREPCDADGITESMGLGYGGAKKKRSFLSENEKLLAKKFSEITGVKYPLAETRRDYAEYQITWWKPIREMLRQVEGNIELAAELIESSIMKLHKDKLTAGVPKSVLSTFFGEVSLRSTGTGKTQYKDQFGNVVEE